MRKHFEFNVSYIGTYEVTPGLRSWTLFAISTTDAPSDGTWMIHLTLFGVMFSIGWVEKVNL